MTTPQVSIEKDVKADIDIKRVSVNLEKDKKDKLPKQKSKDKVKDEVDEEDEKRKIGFNVTLPSFGFGKSDKQEEDIKVKGQKEDSEAVTVPQLSIEKKLETKTGADVDMKDFSVKIGRGKKEKPEETKSDDEDSERKKKSGGFGISFPRFGFGKSSDKPDVTVDIKPVEVKGEKDMSRTLPQLSVEKKHDIKVSDGVDSKEIKVNMDKKDKKDKKEKSESESKKEKPEEVKYDDEDMKKKGNEKSGGFDILFPGLGFGKSGEKPEVDVSLKDGKDVKVNLPDVSLKKNISAELPEGSVGAKVKTTGISLKVGEGKKDKSKKSESESELDEDSEAKEKKKRGFHISFPKFSGKGGDVRKLDATLENDVDIEKKDITVDLPDVSVEKGVSIELPESKVSDDVNTKSFSLKFGKGKKVKKDKSIKDESESEIKSEDEESEKKKKGFKISLPSFSLGGSGDKPEVKENKDLSVTLPEGTVGADVETKGFSLKFERGKKDKFNKHDSEEVKSDKEKSEKKDENKSGFKISLPSFGLSGSAEKPEVDVEGRMEGKDVSVTLPDAGEIDAKLGANVEGKGFSLKFGGGKKDSTLR